MTSGRLVHIVVPTFGDVLPPSGAYTLFTEAASLREVDSAL